MHFLKKTKEFGITNENVQFDFKEVIRRSRDVADKSEKGVQYLMKKNKIDYYHGFGRVKKQGDKTIIEVRVDGKVTDELTSKHTVIATGCRAKSFPNMNLDGKKIVSFLEAIVSDVLPASITIIGAGAIGVEFAYFYNAFGTKVTIVEMLEQLLPVEDKEISDTLAREYRKLGITFHAGTTVESVKVERSGNKEIVKTKVSGKFSGEIESDIALVAVGFAGNIENFGLEELGVITEKGFIKIDKDYKTNIEGIYSIGDVIGPPWLAHVASAEGINCIEKIKGLPVPDVDYTCIPAVTFCQPQVASLGLTEKAAREKGIDIKIGKFPFSASGKGRAIGETTGMVKVIFDAKYDGLVGAHIIGSEASELIAELTLAKSLESTHEQIIKTVHSHPTLSEAVKEAVANAYGESIDI
jgi:dihydrolipoamide dehydrogenase